MEQNINETLPSQVPNILPPTPPVRSPRRIGRWITFGFASLAVIGVGIFAIRNTGPFANTWERLSDFMGWEIRNPDQNNDGVPDDFPGQDSPNESESPEAIQARAQANQSLRLCGDWPANEKSRWPAFVKGNVLPEGFPTDFSNPPNSRVIGSLGSYSKVGKTPTQGAQSVFCSSDDIETVVYYYADWIDNSDWGELPGADTIQIYTYAKNDPNRTSNPDEYWPMMFQKGDPLPGSDWQTMTLQLYNQKGNTLVIMNFSSVRSR